MSLSSASSSKRRCGVDTIQPRCIGGPGSDDDGPMKDFPDDVSEIDDTASVFSYTSHSTMASSFTHGETSFHRKEYVDPKVAVKEQRWVVRAKMAVAAVLLTAMMAMATTTFHFIKKAEYNDFVTQFQNYASEIIAVSEENAANTFRSIAGLSVTITSFTESTGMTWPYVTVPHFDARASAAESLSGVRLLAFAPVVTKKDKPKWEKYVAKNARRTFQESIDYQDMNVSDVNALYLWPYIYQGNIKTFQFNREEGEGPYLPMWQLSRFRPELSGMINYNLNDEARVKKAFATTTITKSPSMNFFVITGTADSILVQPIFDTVMEKGNEERKVVGILWCLIDWLAYFNNIIADKDAEMIAVVKSTDNDAATYQINGLKAKFLGEGDLHDTNFDALEISSEFANLGVDDFEGLPDDLKVPALSVHLYPTESLRKNYETYNAFYYTAGVIAIFVFTSTVFAIFDFTVTRQQAKVMERVIRQDKIVSNLFPQQIRDRLYGVDDEDDSQSKKGKAKIKTLSNGFPDVLDPNDFDNPELFDQPPIADLFPSATVFFADIAGFTAWSSQREPPQVFMLLESLYGAFDKIAYRHGIFKVETTGDCYVAVCGLPEPRKKHATAMAKFARDCMDKFTEMTQKLEITLGPDTGDLEMRCGLHSGQVTAGVLRGERSRFQLFGDTVNTASRMETTSLVSRIQISNTTAELLRKEGKSRWICPRSEKIFVKGKGMMQTCWLRMKKSSSPDPEDETTGSKTSDFDYVEGVHNDGDASEDSECPDDYNNELPEMKNHLSKVQRLIEWNTEVLSKLLQQIVASRSDEPPMDLSHLEKDIGKDQIALDEFKEIVSLPKIRPDEMKHRRDPSEVLLPLHVVAQLRSYITKISAMYLDNPFHNFEHACHVTASVRKMLTRIVSGDGPAEGDDDDAKEEIGLVDLAGHSFGITSDPLTQFAVIFSALIHDAEHPGVPNTRLVEEKTPEAEKYKKSVAEQNSIHKAWDLLMTDEYKDLRHTIYTTEDEMRRFRQLVINVVLATDICDKELGALRKARWATAFSDEPVDSTPELDIDRKATIVIEHLIQASDVSHTMQHWQIYLHWNERFFFELYGAYKLGRADTDPSQSWYKGEIGFYDFYIIPLAKKLDKCGVFGVSSDEYLNYAQLNRDEWEREGEKMVEEFKQKYYAKFPEHKCLPAVQQSS